METQSKKNPTKLGRKILEYMAKRNLNLTEFAKLWGYKRTTVYLAIYEHRPMAHKTMEDLIRLGKGFFTGDDFFNVPVRKEGKWE